ncbi:TPA: hypothetical protein U1Y31_002172, partial [Streptococcus suis]|nr:hypothetical protein [Streptococcus suis]
MNGLKEFFGNIPMFQKQVEREIEEKGIEPSEGIKKMEFSRQVIRNLVIGVLVVGILESGLINCVITKDLSRLGRNYLDCGLYLEVFFPEHNVRYIAVND